MVLIADTPSEEEEEKKEKDDPEDNSGRHAEKRMIRMKFQAGVPRRGQSD